MLNEAHLHCQNILDKINSLTVSNHFYNEDFSTPQGAEAISYIINSETEPLLDPLKSRLRNEFFGNGPIEPLLIDETVTEIIVNDHETLWIERQGRLEEVKDYFLSRLTYERFLRKLFLETGIEPTLTHPFVDSHWRHHRLHMIGVYSTNCNSIRLTLRKHKTTTWTLNELERWKWASPAEIQCLKNLIHEKSNFLVVGPTGSGKTSVLKSLIQECHADERVLVLEDTNELSAPNQVSTQLLTRLDSRQILPSISLSELVHQSLRMRPDRIVIGEIRGGEAKDLLMALATGHGGSASTLHAADPAQSLLRLEMLIQMGAPHWSLLAIRRLILLSLQYIIVCHKHPNGHRSLNGIYKIVSLEDSGFVIETVGGGNSMRSSFTESF